MSDLDRPDRQIALSNSLASRYAWEELDDVCEDRFPLPETTEYSRDPVYRAAQQHQRAAQLYMARIFASLGEGGKLNVKPTAPQRKQLTSSDLKAIQACVHRAITRARLQMEQSFDLLPLDTTTMPDKPAPAIAPVVDEDPEVEEAFEPADSVLAELI